MHSKIQLIVTSKRHTLLFWIELFRNDRLCAIAFLISADVLRARHVRVLRTRAVIDDVIVRRIDAQCVTIATSEVLSGGASWFGCSCWTRDRSAFARIGWMVSEDQNEAKAFFRAGESSYYSKLYVDEANILRKVDPDFEVEHMEPSCACCTHTFNGIPIDKRYDPDRLHAFAARWFL